jgi:hypothetical protein
LQSLFLLDAVAAAVEAAMAVVVLRSLTASLAKQR